MEQHEHSRFAEIEPLCVLRLLVRKAWLIILAALIGAMAASVVLTAAVKQTYSTGVTFAVISRAHGASGYVSMSVAKEVAEIYSELLSGSYMNETIREAAGDVSGSITASQLGNTNLIRVNVTSDNPRDALKIIQVVIEKQGELSEYVSSTAALNPIDSLSLTINTSGQYNTTKVCLTAAVAAAALMVLLIGTICVGTKTVQNRIGAKHNLDGRLLTSVPHEVLPGKRDANQRQSLLITEPLVSFGFSEAISRVASHFEHQNAKGRRVFLLTSTSESEGKSTIAANVALALARKASRVLLIDLDLRRPVQFRILNEAVPPRAELSSLLSGTMTAQEILERVITRPGVDLDLLLASKSNTSAVRLLDSPILEQMISLARQRYDYVIIDTPPLSFFSDSERISDLADASLLVVRQDVVPAPEINDTIDALRAGKSEFLGYILNDMQHLFATSSEYGYHYGSRYYGRYNKYGRYGKYGSYGRYTSGHGKYEKAETASDEQNQ